MITSLHGIKAYLEEIEFQGQIISYTPFTPSPSI